MMTEPVVLGIKESKHEVMALAKLVDMGPTRFLGAKQVTRREKDDGGGERETTPVPIPTEEETVETKACRKLSRKPFESPSDKDGAMGPAIPFDRREESISCWRVEGTMRPNPTPVPTPIVPTSVVLTVICWDARDMKRPKEEAKSSGENPEKDEDRENLKFLVTPDSIIRFVLWGSQG